MRLLEAVDLLNNQGLKIQEVAQKLSISKDFLADILKEQGFVYNNSSKLREYIGENAPDDIDLDEFIAYRKKKRGKRKSDVKSKINNNASVKQNIGELPFNEKEIDYLKLIVNRRFNFDVDFEITYAFSQLPQKEPTKKASYEISNETYEAFEKYAKNVGSPRRISRNDLVEIALQYFMKTFKEQKMAEQDA